MLSEAESAQLMSLVTRLIASPVEEKTSTLPVEETCCISCCTSHVEEKTSTTTSTLATEEKTDPGTLKCRKLITDALSKIMVQLPESSSTRPTIDILISLIKLGVLDTLLMKIFNSKLVDLI